MRKGLAVKHGRAKPKRPGNSKLVLITLGTCRRKPDWQREKRVMEHFSVLQRHSTVETSSCPTRTALLDSARHRVVSKSRQTNHLKSSNHMVRVVRKALSTSEGYNGSCGEARDEKRLSNGIGGLDQWIPLFAISSPSISPQPTWSRCHPLSYQAPP